MRAPTGGFSCCSTLRIRPNNARKHQRENRNNERDGNKFVFGGHGDIVARRKLGVQFLIWILNLLCFFFFCALYSSLYIAIINFMSIRTFSKISFASMLVLQQLFMLYLVLTEQGKISLSSKHIEEKEILPCSSCLLN